MNEIRQTASQTGAPQDVPPSADELMEENKKLRLDNKKLAREIRYQRDINERNKISAAAKDNLSKIVSAEKSRLEKYMNLLLTNSPEIIMLFDSDRHIIFASESYMRINKIPAFGLINGKSYRDLLSPVVSEDFLQRMDVMFQTALSEKRSVHIDYDIDFGGSGNVRHYNVQVTPMLGEGGTEEGAMVFFYDSTEIMRAQLEAERAKELAEQSTRAKSEFLSRMSHEMRTPMNAIIGMTAIARTSDEMERKEYCLEKINEASTHLLGVINDILDMSKIEASKFELSVTEFNFEKMLRRVTSVMNFKLEEKEQNIFVEIDRNIPAMIVSDEQRLAQVITNLLSNAVKFTPGRGSVTIIAEKTAEEDGVCTIRVTVKDTGIGISKEQQKKLFTSFEQADGSISRKFGGTGLGLAISKHIVELMNGRIWIESEEGRGSSFIFEISAGSRQKEAENEAHAAGILRSVQKPLFPSTLEDRVNAYTNQSPQKSEGELDINASTDGTLDGKRILITEDVKINREIVEALIEDTGVNIDFAFDGVEAVEKFSADPRVYDLVLMDVQMPNMDGYEATRKIRASGLPGADSIPIIAMTANVFREDIERCLAAGMNDHLGKPIDASEVIAKLRRYMAR